MTRSLAFLAGTLTALVLSATAHAQELGDVFDATGGVTSGALGVSGTMEGGASDCDADGCQSGSASAGIELSPPAPESDPASGSASVCVLSVCTGDVVDSIPELPPPDLDSELCRVSASCAEAAGGGGSSGGSSRAGAGGGGSGGGGPSDGGNASGGGDTGSGTGSTEEPPGGEQGDGENPGSAAGGDPDSGGSDDGSGAGNPPGTGSEETGDPEPGVNAAANGDVSGSGAGGSEHVLDCATGLAGDPLGGETGGSQSASMSLLGAATGSIAAFGWAALGAVVCAAAFVAGRRRLGRQTETDEWFR